MAALVETIAVVNKSGKAVSTSKHLVNVFKEAKAAYQERKAEVVAGRQATHKDGDKTPRALKATAEMSSLADTLRTDPNPTAAAIAEHRKSAAAPMDRSGVGRHLLIQSTHPPHNRFSQDLVTLDAHSPPPSPSAKRSHKTPDNALALSHRKPVPPRRSMTSPDVDMGACLR